MLRDRFFYSALFTFRAQMSARFLCFNTMQKLDTILLRFTEPKSVLSIAATIGFILTIAATARCQSSDVEKPDTLVGIALVYEKYLYYSAGDTIAAPVVRYKAEPYESICVRYPIDMVPASAVGRNVGYVTRYFRKDTGDEIAANDVLMFKIRLP